MTVLSVCLDNHLDTFKWQVVQELFDNQFHNCKGLINEFGVGAEMTADYLNGVTNFLRVL